MSHKKLISTLLILIILLVVNCAKLGEAQLGLSQQNTVPTQPISTNITKPGMGSDGGPSTWSFWVKNRQATSDAMLGSFAPFYKVTANRHAVSANFVLYRDSLASNMTASQAATVLATMETAFVNLKSVYGAGQKPDANNNARIVILAYDILDDYSTTLNYVGGFFAPRDLYANTFTTALYTDPVTIQQYSSVIATLGGYSNEMSIIYYDLSPGYSTNPSQVNDIVIHELSHLFTYNRRVVKERLVNHDVWIAEGIAENAPHQTIQTANVEQLRLTQLSSPATIDYYQDAPQLTDFATWGPKVIGYIQSNLFFNYLRHRAEMNTSGSAATMLAELMTTPDQTITGLESMIGKYIPGNNFSSIYADYVITNYLMFLGIPIDSTVGMNGGVASTTQYSMNNVQIGNSASTINGTTIKSKYPIDLPFNYESPKCSDGSNGLKPNSYIVFRHQVNGDKTPTDSRSVGSTELPLKFVVNKTNDLTLINAPPASSTLATYDAGTTIPFGTLFALNDYVQVIVYNANKTGACLAFDATLIAKRDHSRWTGSNSYGVQNSPDFYWQSDVGAPWSNNTNGGFYRPAGIAAYTNGYPNNFLYVVDYTAMSVQKMGLDDGSPIGRLGNTSSTCPTTGTGWDTFSNRYLNNYCAHSFDAPQGVLADASNNIYVADTNNRRIVKYDAAGNFSGWIGLNGTCAAGAWQGSGNVTDPYTLYLANALTDPCMFYAPWALASNGTDIFVVDSVVHRISRRNLATGNFVSYLGNGSSTWNVSTASISAANLSPAANTGYFYNPSGLTLDPAKTYLFVADKSNNRIVRINIASSAATWIGNGTDGWQAITGATTAATASGAVRFFTNPSGVAADSTYLYITDTSNNRIVRWDHTTGNFQGWLGWGKVKWEMTASVPASDPYAGVSFYPPDYYAEPLAITLATTGTPIPPMTAGMQKGGTNSYLYFTSIYNGRITRVNIGCANNPISANCAASHAFP